MNLRPTYPVLTERLRLRPLGLADLPDLLAYRGDAGVCRFLPFEPMDEAVLTERLSGDLGRREITAPGQALTLGAELATTGRVVGDVVIFFHSAPDAAGELGYVFHPDVAGQGFASEACAAVLDLAFEQLGLHRVTARMDGRNVASRRLVERLGFRQEARHRSSVMFKGSWADLVICAVLAEEWRSAAAERRGR